MRWQFLTQVVHPDAVIAYICLTNLMILGIFVYLTLFWSCAYNMPTVACFDGVFAHSLTHMVLQPLYNCRLLSCVTGIALPLNEKIRGSATCSYVFYVSCLVKRTRIWILFIIFLLRWIEKQDVSVQRQTMAHGR